MDGLGLLDVTTTLMPQKVTAQRQVRVIGDGFVSGYEIHHGQTLAGPQVLPHLEQELGWQGETHDWNSFLDAQIDHVARLVEDTGWANFLLVMS